MGTHWGRASYRGEDSRGWKRSRVSLLSWNETLVRRRESARRVQPGRLRPGLEEDARLPRQETTIIRLKIGRASCRERGMMTRVFVESRKVNRVVADEIVYKVRQT